MVHRQKAISGSKLYHIDKIYWLVEDCKKYGSLPFAGMARCGFVAIETLNSLVDEKYISLDEKNRFLQNINTIMIQMKRDLKKISKLKFLDKYGHLRPNTYEITSLNYKENFNQYFKNLNRKKIKIKTYKNRNLKYLKTPDIKKIGFNCRLKNFEKFLKEAIIFREYSKFLFSKI